MKKKSKSNLYINTGQEIYKKPGFLKNKSIKFNSLINNKSLTTNESGSSFSKPYNTIDQNYFNQKFNRRKNQKFSYLNMLSTYNSNNKGFSVYSTNNIFLPKIKADKERKILFDKADTILKFRQKKNMAYSLKQTKSILMQRTNEIRLKNFLITHIKERRNELCNLDKAIADNLNNAEMQFNTDYKNFINFEEDIITKEKQEQEESNNLRNKISNIENTYIKTKLKTQYLEQNIESTTKQIILLQSYAKFIHKVFDSPFFFEEIKNLKLKDKKYLTFYEKIISIFEKNKSIFEANYHIINETEEFMKRFGIFESNILLNIKKKKEIEDNVNDIKILNNKSLEQIIMRKNDLEQELISLNKIKQTTNDSINYYSIIKQNSSLNLELGMKYILELSKEFGLEKNKTGEEISVSEFMSLCQNILSILEEKEVCINEHINTIENLINKEDDKENIEDIIFKRKIENKKNKFKEYIFTQQIEKDKKKFKNKKERIILKGRKVFQDIPFYKKKKKKIKIKINNDYENYEFLNYFSDKEN